jgi:hypothetical protein
MKTSDFPALVWLHDEALSGTHPVFSTAPKNSRVIFIWDEAIFQKRNWSLKRLVFLYESLCDLKVEILRGDTELIFNQFSNLKIYVAESADPVTRAQIQSVAKTRPVQIVPNQIFAEFKSYKEPQRFFQYWKKIEASALKIDGGIDA